MKIKAKSTLSFKINTEISYISVSKGEEKLFNGNILYRFFILVLYIEVRGNEIIYGLQSSCAYINPSDLMFLSSNNSVNQCDVYFIKAKEQAANVEVIILINLTVKTIWRVFVGLIEHKAQNGSKEQFRGWTQQWEKYKKVKKQPSTIDYLC